MSEVINTSINQRINACMTRMRAPAWQIAGDRRALERLSAKATDCRRAPSTGAAELQGGQSKEWPSAKHAKAARHQVDQAATARKPSKERKQTSKQRKESINQSITQSINQSINQSLNQSINQSFNHSIIQSAQAWQE